MARLLPKTSERLIPDQLNSRDDYLQFLRHVFAYEFAGQMLADSQAVLDLGSGEGYGSALLAAHVAQVTGIDVDRDAVTHANEAHGLPNCRFVQSEGGQLPFDEATFDAAVSFQVIEHVADDAKCIAEVARVLRPGAKFILTTPNRVNRLKPGGKPWNRFHLREYSAADLRELLAGSFAELEVMGITAGAEVHAIEMARIRQSLKIVAMDPLNLRRLIPDGLKPLVTAVARCIMPRREKDTGDEDWRSRYSLADYCTTTDDVDSSLDLLAICTR